MLAPSFYSNRFISHPSPTTVDCVNTSSSGKGCATEHSHGDRAIPEIRKFHGTQGGRDPKSHVAQIFWGKCWLKSQQTVEVKTRFNIETYRFHAWFQCEGRGFGWHGLMKPGASHIVPAF